MSDLKSIIDSESGKRVYETADIPAIGAVTVRSLTEEEWQEGVLGWAVNQDWTRNPDRKRFENAKLVQMSLVDPDTKNLLYTDSVEDVSKLARLRTQIFQPLYDFVFKFQRPAAPKN